VKTGLVLEGGGMRGLYTVGVLDCFMDHNITFDYVVGVSAGACNGATYLAGQLGRGLRVNTNYLRDKRYLSLYNFFKTKSFFGMDFIFDEIPNRLDPLDYDALQASPAEYIVGATDVETGLTTYFNKHHIKNNCLVLRASSSIPVLSPVVEYNGRKYLDGGTTDPIPVHRAVEDGCKRLIVVLTQARGYKKRPEKFRLLYKHIFRTLPKMVEALDNRHIRYNRSLTYASALESAGLAVIIAPSTPLGMGRFEKNRKKLKKAYDLGLHDAKQKLPLILRLLR